MKSAVSLLFNECLISWYLECEMEGHAVGRRMAMAMNVMNIHRCIGSSPTRAMISSRAYEYNDLETATVVH